MLDSVPQGDSVPLADDVPPAAAPGSASVVRDAAAAAPSGAVTDGTPATDATQQAKKDAAPLWLRRTDQLVVGMLLVALVVLLTVHWLRLSRWGTASIELTSQQPRAYFYSLDINTASWVEWAQLDGIGEKLAKRIVADRDERGPYRDASDIGRVRGIHAKQLESMKPFLHGGTATEVASP